MTSALLFLIAVGLCAAMTFAWAIQRRTGNSGWVDTIWSASVGIATLAALAFAATGDTGRKWTAAVLVLLWAARLATHIGGRSAGASEDPRYEALIKEWGDKASSRLFLFLQAQAAAAFILVLSALAAATGDAAFPSITDGLAAAVALVALAGEAISDRQLAQFRKDNAGRKAICDVGLWRWSRHPNYFFEWLFWCAWPVMALGSHAAIGLPLLLSLLAPILMYWLLVHVSGIPPLEAHMLASRGERFRIYQSKVNAFFPGPRRSSASEEIAR
ncbi:DUF1295 domain-containing protein [Rhizobium sp. PAMB 3174]